MQFSTSLLALLSGGLSISSVSATPTGQKQEIRQAPPRGQIPQAVTNLLSTLPANAPDPLDAFFPETFGVTRGVPFGDGSADCQGATPEVRIDCSCPPDVDDPTFRAAVKIALNKGFYPEPDQTVPIGIEEWNNGGEEVQKSRNTVMVIALQSLQGVNDMLLGGP